MSDCFKVSYKNKKRAKQAAYAIKAKGKILPHEALIPYWCNSCSSYHLTHLSATEFLNKVAKFNK